MHIPFVQARSQRWTRLEELLKKAEKSKLVSFSKEELLELSVLYRQASGDLSFAKTQGLPDELILFLNDLVTRAYHRIYRAEKSSFHQIADLFKHEFPDLFRQNLGVILFTFGLLLFGWLLGFLGYLTGPKVILGLFPKNFDTEFFKNYQNRSWFNSPFKDRPFISSWIMINNIKVAINAFAGGMLLGTLTCYVVIFNGLLLGVLSAVFFTKGSFISFWAMILPHGVIELTAIGLAAAAGFLLTRAILFPGELSRVDSLKVNGEKAMKLMLATTLMFVIAALIEGFFSFIDTKIISEYGRLIFAGLTAVLLVWYFRIGLVKTARYSSDKDNVPPHCG